MIARWKGCAALAAAGWLTAMSAPARGQPQPEQPAAPPAEAEPADAEAAEPDPAPAPEPEPKREIPPAPAEQPPGATRGEREAAAAAQTEEEVEERWVEKLRLELGPFHFAPVVLLMTHVSPYVGDDSYFQSGDAAERPGFRLRNARFGFDAGYTDQARVRVTGEVGSIDETGTARIQDAWAAYLPFDFLGIYAGAITMPFARSRLIPSGRGALIERPLMSRAMAPGNQIGGVVQGEVADSAFGYAVGVFNGLQRSSQFYEGYTVNYAPFGNRFDGVAAVARLTTEPLGPLAPSSADEAHGPFRFGFGGNYLFSDGGARDIHSAGGDLHVQVAGFHIMAEGLWSLSLPEDEPTQPTTELGEITSFGVMAEVGYVILPRTLGITGRFEWIEPNIDSDDESDNWLITGGAFYQFLDELFKVQADYTHREERFGLRLANDSLTLSLQAQLDPGRARRAGR